MEQALTPSNDCTLHDSGNKHARIGLDFNISEYEQRLA